MAFLAARPIEDFFINPTFGMDFSLDSHSDLFASYNAYSHHKRAASLTSRSAKSIPRSTAHQQPTASMAYIPEQPDYFHGYASEEEIASPVDADDLSFRSSHESSDSAITPNSYLADAVQQCSRAQAVRIQPVGKAKVVDLPKLDLSYRRTSQPSSSFTSGRRGSRLVSIQETRSTRSSQDSHSRNDSMDSSATNSPASTAPSSVDEEEHSRIYRHSTKGSLRHVPLMEAVKAISPTDSFETPRSATLPRRSLSSAYRHSVDLSDQHNPPASPAASYRPTIRKMAKFSSIINLNLLGRDGKENYDTQSIHSVKGSEAQNVSSRVTSRNIPVRRSSTQQKRLIARGANERAPTMSLPPFPGE